MVSLDSTILIQMINFLILIFILNMLLYKPILGIMDKRKKRFQDTEDEIKSINLTIEERMAAYEEKVRLAKMDALNQKNDILKEGSDQAKTIIDAARGEIPGMMEEFHGKMNREVTDARRILTDQSRKISVDIAEKLLGRSIQ
ncbi:MAG: ATP synthase F0 subunit B [Deltaproteobacteria bacterium]|nr:ATP synthase F0 subunit B [Deltaproteobacteria bacterium]